MLSLGVIGGDPITQTKGRFVGLWWPSCVHVMELPLHFFHTLNTHLCFTCMNVAWTWACKQGWGKKHRWDRLVYLLSQRKRLCCMTRPQPSLSMSCDEEVLHIFFFLSFILSYFTLFFSSFPSTVNLIGLTVSYSNIWVMRLNHCRYVRQSCKRIKKKSYPTPSLFYIHWLLFFWIPTTPFWIN